MEKFATSEYIVTYLLGAGASANVLPTVKDIGEKIGLSKALKSFAIQLAANNTLGTEHQEFRKQLVSNLNWLAEKSLEFGTIDTFAKYLYLRDRGSLDKLKEALTIYFIHEQYLKNKSDNRPIIFLTTVMQNENIFPTNIKILNWNYDSQIQIAAEVFRTEQFSKGASTSVHKPPLIGYYPNLGYDHTVNQKEIQMIHLNGIAGIYFNVDEGINNNRIKTTNINSLESLFNSFIMDQKIKQDLFTFAWENDTIASHRLNNRIELAQRIIEDTNILVVIGYSFPFFNREIDKKIFESLKKSKNFKKIYFQDPLKKGDFLRNQFLLSDEIEIEHVDKVDNYFVPNEL